MDCQPSCLTAFPFSLLSLKPENAEFKFKKKGYVIKSSLVDQSGNLWLGTDGFGVLKITARKSSIKSYGDFYFGKNPYMSEDGEIIVDEPFYRA